MAVASNFATTAKKLGARFASRTGIEIKIAAASTGVLYQQIENGAPFDLFLSADRETVDRLVGEKKASSADRWTYAIGKLILWTAKSGVGGEALQRELSAGKFRHVGIASPKTAPYGRAGMQVLKRLGLSEGDSSRIVVGENIGQAFQFAETGAVEFSLVALSQAKAATTVGSYWLVPENWYEPIRQDAVVLSATSHPVEARKFLEFLKSEEAARVIAGDGYASEGRAKP